MTEFNPELFALARHRVFVKQALQPPGGAPPAGPPGMAPPGMAPPPGGAPPASGPGMPPPGMAPPGMAPPMTGAMGMPLAPQAAPQGQTGSGKPKFDPLMLDYRMYNIQQQLTAIMNGLNIQLPPDALIMPPGSMGPPPAEAAMPGMGGPVDTATQGGQGQQPGGQQQSAIQPIEPMQGAQPQPAGPAPKTAAEAFGAAVAGSILDPSPVAPVEWWNAPEPARAESYIGDPVSTQLQTKAAALAQMFRHRISGEPHAGAAA